MATERRREINDALLDGYRQHPAKPPDDFVESLADGSIVEEPWSRRARDPDDSRDTDRGGAGR